jgi:seryl-tRNA synthetase
MAHDAIATLRQQGDIALDHDARLCFRGAAAELHGWLGAQLEQMILSTGAAPLEVPTSIDRGTLTRAGYFESFADGAIAVSADGSAFLPPAACYHAYPSMQGLPLDAPLVVTLAAACGRREDRTTEDVGRLRRFHMRESVFVGAGAWVSAERDAWMRRAGAFADGLGLTGVMTPATDTFFGGEGRGRRLIQKIKQLKFELRMDAGSAGQLAVASFNLHESFFTSRFGIGPLPDGSTAMSGCAAFGLERWTLVCLAQLAPTAIQALIDGGMPRSTTNT